MSRMRCVGFLAVCLCLPACSQTPSHLGTVEEEAVPGFGEAVRAMVREQTCIKNTYCTGSAGGRLEGWEATRILQRYQASPVAGGT